MSVVLRWLLLLALIAGIFISQVYVIGFDSHRFLAPSWWFLIAAVFVGCLGVKSNARGGVTVGSLLLVLVSYVSMRGYFSEVPSLAIREVPLVCFGAITFYGAFLLSQRRWSFAILSVALGVLFLWQLVINFAEREQYAFLFAPMGAIYSQTGEMHGFFQHHNPFSTYCAISAVALVGVCFIKTNSRVVSAFKWFGLIVVIGFGAYQVFLSESRLGMATYVASTALSCSCLVFGVFMSRKGKTAKKTLNTFVVSGVVFLAALGVGGGLVSKAYEKVSEERHRTGQVDDDFMADMRSSSIGLGIALWFESPIIGNGPRSFYYKVPAMRSQKTGMSVYSVDPEMVHNDYIQTLAEYGVVGLCLVFAFVTSVIIFHWRIAWRYRSMDVRWFVSPAVTSAASFAVMMHSLGDFTLHILPVFLQYAVVLGAGYGWSSRYSRLQPAKSGVYLLKWGIVFVAVGALFLVARPQVVHRQKLAQYDTSLRSGLATEYRAAARTAMAVAPDSFLLERFSRHLVRQSHEVSDQAMRATLLNEALSYSRRSYELHPYYIPTLVNYADLCLSHGDFEMANRLIIEAFELSNQRWKMYHVGKVADRYLTLKGEQLWGARRASEARAYFEKAQQYNRNGYRIKNKEMNKLRQQLKERTLHNLKVLDQGRVQASEDITFFNENGL